MEIQINKVHFPVTTLGYGRRVGIWTQGCSIRCPGCVSRDTWETHAGSAIEVDMLLEGISKWLRQADGVTVSGGEPFDQPEALSFLLGRIRAECSGDILVYSGYSKERLFTRFSPLVGKIDVLISEPYTHDCSDNLYLRGSDNQKISFITDLARSIYPEGINFMEKPDRPSFDVSFDGETLWLAGIPKRGELKQFKEILLRNGYSCVTSESLIVRA